MEYLISSFIKQNKTHQDKGETFKFGCPNNKGKWRGNGISLNSIYSLNTLAKLLFHHLFSFIFLLFFSFSLFIFLMHSCLNLCVSTSLNLYSSWLSWGIQQLRINDGILLKKEGRHAVNDGILLMVSSSSQDGRKLEVNIRASLIWKGWVQSCTGSPQKAPFSFSSAISISDVCHYFSDAAVQHLMGCCANQQGLQRSVCFTISFQKEVFKKQVGVALPNIV